MGSELVAVPIFRCYTVFATGCLASRLTAARTNKRNSRRSLRALRYTLRVNQPPFDAKARI